MNVTIPAHIIRAALICCDDKYYHLNRHVEIGPETIRSTNGVRLFHCRYITGLDRPIVVNFKSLKVAASVVSISFELPDAAGDFTVTAHKKSSTEQFSCELVDIRYPDCERVLQSSFDNLRKTSERVAPQLQADHLSSICKAFPTENQNSLYIEQPSPADCVLAYPGESGTWDGTGACILIGAMRKEKNVARPY